MLHCSVDQVSVHLIPARSKSLWCAVLVTCQGPVNTRVSAAIAPYQPHHHRAQALDTLYHHYHHPHLAASSKNTFLAILAFIIYPVLLSMSNLDFKRFRQNWKKRKLPKKIECQLFIYQSIWDNKSKICFVFCVWSVQMLNVCLEIEDISNITNLTSLLIKSP